MTQINRRTFLGAGAALGLSPVPGLLWAQGEGAIRIGLIIPLTGATSQFGATMSRAAQIAAAEINAAGGVRGRKVEVVIEDDQSNPEAAVRAARKLIDVDRVVAIGRLLRFSCYLGHRAAVLGKQDGAVHGVGRGQHHQAAAPGIHLPHLADGDACRAHAWASSASSWAERGCSSSDRRRRSPSPTSTSSRASSRAPEDRCRPDLRRQEGQLSLRGGSGAAHQARRHRARRLCARHRGGIEGPVPRRLRRQADRLFLRREPEAPRSRAGRSRRGGTTRSCRQPLSRPRPTSG